MATAPVQDPFVLRCEGALTLASAAVHREQLLQAIDRNQSILVDISGAEEMDVTFVQLLVSARKSATAYGKSLYIGAPNDGEPLGYLARAHVSDAEFPPCMNAPIGKAVPMARPEQGGDIDAAVVTTLINEIGAAAVCQSLEVFFTEMDARVDALRILSEEANLSEIRRETHLLKGTAGTFGLRGLMASVVEFDRSVGTLGAGYEAALDRIAGTLQQAQEALRPLLATEV